MIDNQIEKGLSDPILIFSDQVRQYYGICVTNSMPNEHKKETLRKINELWYFNSRKKSDFFREIVKLFWYRLSNLDAFVL